MRTRFNAIGCTISRKSINSALNTVVEQVRDGTGGYLCLTNVHAAVMARMDPNFRKVVNESLMSLPDGKPIYWVGRLQAVRELGHVPGPAFLTALLAEQTDPPLQHFFYDGRPEIVATLVDKLKARFPSAIFVGAESRPLP